MAEIEESYGDCTELRDAAMAARADYRWSSRLKFTLSHIRLSINSYRSLKALKSKENLTGHSGRMRALLSCLDIFDETALEAWQYAINLPPQDSFGALYWAFDQKHKELADVQLRKRGLILKDQPRNLLIALHHSMRKASEDASSLILLEWIESKKSIRLARHQATLCHRTVEQVKLEGTELVSLHFDKTHFKDCSFINCDFSNSSFEGSVFKSCIFHHVTCVNARLRYAVFDNCDLVQVDLRGASLEDLRMWYRNRFSQNSGRR